MTAGGAQDGHINSAPAPSSLVERLRRRVSRRARKAGAYVRLSNRIAHAVLKPTRAPGQSGATVVRVTRADGAQWIEKARAASDFSNEARVMK